MKFTPAVILMLLAVAGCGRSPEEQLAYQHAEEQYQINMRSAERFRQDPDAAQEQDQDADAGRGQRSRE